MPLAPLYDITDHPLLANAENKFNKLATPEEKTAQQLLAEMLLNLRAPAYAGDDAEELGFAVALQIIFQMERGVEPATVKSVSNTHPGNTTAFRDRYVAPEAWAIVSRVTGVKTVGFTVPGIGV